MTVSDSVAVARRDDASGDAVASRVARLGLLVDRAVVADDRAAIAAIIRRATGGHALVVTTGGTGLTPRDVTPQGTRDAIDYEIPGLAEAMRAAGRAATPLADLSRGVAGVAGRTLVVNLPGSPRGALESFDAIAGILPHALETLAGPFDHSARQPARPPSGDAT